MNNKIQTSTEELVDVVKKILDADQKASEAIELLGSPPATQAPSSKVQFYDQFNNPLFSRMRVVVRDNQENFTRVELILLEEIKVQKDDFIKSLNKGKVKSYPPYPDDFDHYNQEIAISKEVSIILTVEKETDLIDFLNIEELL